MTLETQVQGLTVATESLLQSVNTRKADLDAAENLTEAQLQFPGFFTTAMSADGVAPATHFVSSGYYLDTELDVLVNDVTWPRRVVFGDTQESLVKLGLMAVQEATDAT